MGVHERTFRRYIDRYEEDGLDGLIDKRRPTQFGRAMAQLGIEMIPAYSPEARGRSERAFATHQGHLPGSWPPRVSPISPQPFAIWPRPTGVPSTRSSGSRRRNPVQPSSL
uniref:helix-turn-helix domain-containing protein n=1 Tax=Nitrococcus mobilis TaxID=35797 RepID=UPI0038CDA03B